jgi:hypothetical protein
MHERYLDGPDLGDMNPTFLFNIFRRVPRRAK